MNKAISINGMTAYHVTTDILRQMYDNKNLVILVSKVHTPNIPVFYIRYNDYISSVRLTNAGYCETQEPYNLHFFPVIERYYQERDFERTMTELQNDTEIEESP